MLLPFQLDLHHAAAAVVSDAVSGPLDADAKNPSSSFHAPLVGLAFYS